jgi:hypothetical protein
MLVLASVIVVFGCAKAPSRRLREYSSGLALRRRQRALRRSIRRAKQRCSRSPRPSPLASWTRATEAKGEAQSKDGPEMGDEAFWVCGWSIVVDLSCIYVGKRRGVAEIAGWLRQRLAHGTDSEIRQPCVQSAESAFVRSSNEN